MWRRPGIQTNQFAELSWFQNHDQHDCILTKLKQHGHFIRPDLERFKLIRTEGRR